MKINERIRAQRLTKKFTQEQVASYLGVTASAVNKWEKGISYPDITLLPPLARLLDTDLNTLLSFQEELTQKEINSFLHHLSEIFDKNGFQQTYKIAMEKIKEYPTCYPLVLNVALFLDGSLLLDQNLDHYKTAIESLYQRVLDSPDQAIRSQAQSILISKCMERKEYAKTEEMLQCLPDQGLVDKKQLQVKLYMAYGKLEEAAKLEEEKLLSAINEIQTILMTLMEIACREERMEDAQHLADVSENSAKLFDLSEYHSYIAHFQLYSSCNYPEKCIKILIPMLKSLTHKWDIKSSPLYRHIQAKENNKQLGLNMQKSLIRSIYSDKETSYLKDSQELQALIKELKLDQIEG